VSAQLLIIVTVLDFVRQGYGSFSKRHLIGPAQWPHHDLFFVHQGVIELEFPFTNRRLALKRGQGLLVWPHTAFRGRALGQTARASIQHFLIRRGEPAPFDSLAVQRNGWSAQTSPAGAQLTRDVERAIALGREPASSPRTRLQQQALLTLILTGGGFLDSSLPAMPPVRINLAALEAWLRTQLSSNPGVSELAQHNGLSASRFRAVFLAEHGRTAGDFIRAVREAEARRRLSETCEPLKAVASALGYADPVAFHHAFKTRTGVTPARFRRENQING